MALYTEPEDTGEKYRARLLEQIHELIGARQKEADLRRAEFFKPDTSSTDAYLKSLGPLRERFRGLLGWPLTESREGVPPMRQEFVAEDELGSMYRVWIQTFPQIETYGLLFIPKSEAPHPLVLAQHGGGGTPELCSNLFRLTNYNDMPRRILRRNCAVFVPQLPMWREDFGPAVEREALDRKLKQAGGSIAALDIHQLRRSLDALLDRDDIDENRVAMMGLSWGGFYTLVTTALEPRIRAALTSCFFNNRYQYDKAPAVWFGSANLFLDAEIACLVCPRPLCIEVGREDTLFNFETARPEAEKVRSVYEKLGIESRFRYHEHPDGHEFDKADGGIEFIMGWLNRE